MPSARKRMRAHTHTHARALPTACTWNFPEAPLGRSEDRVCKAQLGFTIVRICTCGNVHVAYWFTACAVFRSVVSRGSGSAERSRDNMLRRGLAVSTLNA
eukprot:11906100-Alexandrium_andersonii.AAC.1